MPNGTVVRGPGARRLTPRGWLAGVGIVGAVAVLALVVATTGSPDLGDDVLSSETPSPPCRAAPTVQYVPADAPATPLSDTATLTVDAEVGEPVTVRFVGDCAAGGRLAISGAGPGANALDDVWSGQVSGSWTPVEPGTRFLRAMWACTGDEPCPLVTLGYLRVVTPEAGPLDPGSPSGDPTPSTASVEPPSLDPLAPGVWELSADPDVTEAQRALAAVFVQLALDPASVPDGLDLADAVGLGAGATIERSVPARRLTDVRAWDVAAQGGYERDGPFNALSVLAARINGSDDYSLGPYGGHLSVHVGDHPGCPSTGVETPAEYSGVTQVWISPADGAIDTCIDWFAVSLFVDDGTVLGVTVELGSP